MPKESARARYEFSKVEQEQKRLRAKKALESMQASDKAKRKGVTGPSRKKLGVKELTSKDTQKQIDDLSKRTKAFKDRGQKATLSQRWSTFKKRYGGQTTAHTKDVKRAVPEMKTDAERRAARKKK